MAADPPNILQTHCVQRKSEATQQIKQEKQVLRVCPANVIITLHFHMDYLHVSPCRLIMTVKHFILEVKLQELTGCLEAV